MKKGKLDMSATKKVVPLRKPGRPKRAASEPISLDKNVPLPTARTKYPFTEMQIGDSFTVPATKNSVASARGSISAWKKQHKGWNFVTRQDGDTLRVWRTA